MILAARVLFFAIVIAATQEAYCDLVMLDKVEYKYSGIGAPFVAFHRDGLGVSRVYFTYQVDLAGNKKRFRIAASECNIRSAKLYCAPVRDDPKPTAWYVSSDPGPCRFDGVNALLPLRPPYGLLVRDMGGHVKVSTLDGNSCLERPIKFSGEYDLVRVFEDKFVVRYDAVDSFFWRKLAVFSSRGNLLGIRAYDERTYPDVGFLDFREEVLALSAERGGYSLRRSSGDVSNGYEFCGFSLPGFKAEAKVYCDPVDLGDSEVMAMTVDDKGERVVIDWYDNERSANYVGLFFIRR